MLQYDTVIVANGEPPAHPEALRLLREACTVVCCDGAVGSVVALGAEPTVIVGDGDSITSELAARFADRICPDRSEEYNDLTKAVNYCEKKGVRRFAILGGGGRREDHLLGNISLLVSYSRKFEVVMVTNYGIFTPIHQTTTFDCRVGQPVSVFSFTPETRITYHGLKYPVSLRQFARLWEGTLNVTESDAFTIELHDEGDVVIFQAFTNNDDD